VLLRCVLFGNFSGVVFIVSLRSGELLVVSLFPVRSCVSSCRFFVDVDPETLLEWLTMGKTKIEKQ